MCARVRVCVFACAGALTRAGTRDTRMHLHACLRDPMRAHTWLWMQSKRAMPSSWTLFWAFAREAALKASSVPGLHWCARSSENFIRLHAYCKRGAGPFRALTKRYLDVHKDSSAGTSAATHLENTGLGPRLSARTKSCRLKLPTRWHARQSAEHTNPGGRAQRVQERPGHGARQHLGSEGVGVLQQRLQKRGIKEVSGTGLISGTGLGAGRRAER